MIAIENDKIKITWTSGNLFVDFLDGKFANKTFKWGGERLIGGRFAVIGSKWIEQWKPEKRIATNEEIDYVVSAVRQKSQNVVFCD